MILVERFRKSLERPERFSYLFVLGILVLTGLLQLGGMLVAALFACLALNYLNFLKGWGKWLAVVLFVILLSALSYSLVHFVNHTLRATPEIADKAIPGVIQFARQYEIELPFTDYDSLKETAITTIKTQVKYVGNVARLAEAATEKIVLLVFGLIIAVCLFLHPHFNFDGRTRGPAATDLYSACTRAIEKRFTLFYRSFELVIGAQILISAINTALTAIFVVAVDLPYAIVIVGVTFLCGLLPVVGNLISNTIIVGIGFTVSPRMALTALVFLVVIHKLEYFLNSKIIGRRIKNPVWLTLVALIVGERLMGIPGMILAPVVLHYLKEESSTIQSETEPAQDAEPEDTPLATPGQKVG